MKKVLLVSVLGATALLAACGGPRSAERRIVNVEHIVVEGPTFDADACYLRVRPAADENAAPSLRRYLKPITPPPQNIYKIAYDKCRQSKPGDVVEIADVVDVPTKSG